MMHHQALVARARVLAAAAIVGAVWVPLAGHSQSASGLLHDALRLALPASGQHGANTSGTLGPNVQIDGIAILNGRVYIDGVEVRKASGRYVSPRTGKRYDIRRDDANNVSVTELD